MHAGKRARRSHCCLETARFGPHECFFFVYSIVSKSYRTPGAEASAAMETEALDDLSLGEYARPRVCLEIAP